MRVEQPAGADSKGSLKWIQAAIEKAPHLLQPESLDEIEWLSPLASDNFAEYRDSSFLKLLGHDELSSSLKGFWPARGPQWDALGQIEKAPVLVEAKAHINEFLSPPSQAGFDSKKRIDRAMKETQEALGATPRANWCDTFYQYANRLAHLHWFHKHDIKAHLIFVSFTGDTEMRGPSIPETWSAIFQVADYVLGIPARHPLRRYIHHVTPAVNDIPVAHK